MFDCLAQLLVDNDCFEDCHSAVITGFLTIFAGEGFASFIVNDLACFIKDLCLFRRYIELVQQVPVRLVCLPAGFAELAEDSLVTDTQKRIDGLVAVAYKTNPFV
ncbi:MAG: hypothetical protein ABSH16_06620 [Sedimentisphaerales bacterium]